MPERPRVVLLGLDGFPRAALSPTRTPHLWSLGALAGRADLPASTYPGFASLLTGRVAARHGVWCTAIGGTRPGWAGSTQVRVPTLFDLCRAAGLGSAAIQGDHNLHVVLRTASADLRWPPDGVVPPGPPLDLHGYPANRAVRPHLLAALTDRSLTFVFGHLNEVDSLGHDRGPTHADTLARCAESDALVGEVLEAIRPAWSSTLLVIVADHDMEVRAELPPIDLLAEPDVRACADDVWPDGGAALVHLRPQAAAGASPGRVSPGSAAGASPERAIARAAGVACTSWLDHDVLVAGAQPGRMFRAQRYSAAGYHGGPGTAQPLAAVAGGHPAVASIAAALRTRAPHLADWAPTIAGVLGLDASAMDGLDLAAAVPAT